MCEKKMNQNEIVSRIKNEKWKFNDEVFVIF